MTPNPSRIASLQALAATVAAGLGLVLAAYALTRPAAAPTAWAHGLPLLAIAALSLLATPRSHRAGWRGAMLAWPILWWPIAYVMTVDVVQLDPTRYVDGWLRLADAELLGLVWVEPLRWPMGGPAEEVANTFYFSYYVGVPLLVLWLARQHGAEAATRAGLAVVLTVALCAAVWLIAPSGGYHASGAPASVPYGPSTWTVHEMYALKPHFAAAFPSSHVAVAAAVAGVAIRFGGTPLLWVWVLGIAFATVYGQYHFLVDAPAGWIVGGLGAAIAVKSNGLVVPDAAREWLAEARKLLEQR